MAVEFRCPECRSKLRLSEAPEEDSEVECSKCGHVFATDENRVHAGSGEEDEKPVKKKKTENDDEKPKKKPAEGDEKKPQTTADKTKKKGEPKPFKRKKRRAKKKETNKVLLWSVIGGSVVLLSIAAGLMIWMVGKKTPTQEMMSYLPDDCDEVSGLNIGHMQKYPEFFKAAQTLYATKGFKKAGDVLAKALGSSDGNEVTDTLIQGTGKAGGKSDGDPVEATVIRTKAEFDPNQLSQMPGAREGSLGGVKYYAIDDIPELGYKGGVRVFAPTNRIVVFCQADLPESKFKAMLSGNKDNSDNTFFTRAGPLIKAISRGTAWKITLYGRAFPQPTGALPGQSDRKGESPEEVFNSEIKDICNGAKGSGYKASVGSRDIRGEWVVWLKDSDAASSMAKKWKEKEWVKDDEKPAPRWWSTIVASKSGGGKTAENALKDNLGFRSSSDTFSVRASLETKTLAQGMSQLVGSFVGTTGGMGGRPGALPGGAGPGGAGPGGNTPGGGPAPIGPPGKGGPQPITPKKRRRFRTIRAIK
jgi:hypothetical protein